MGVSTKILLPRFHVHGEEEEEEGGALVGGCSHCYSLLQDQGCQTRTQKS